MKIIKSTAVPLSVENIDTDQIIPARFLKAIDRKGFGENLFRDWRFNSDGTPKIDFVLNNPTYQGKILVAGKNFGSGSSREHAAWALYDYGFKTVVSSSFSDIFKNNALNNNLLPVEVSEDFLKTLFDTVQNSPKTKIEINLEKQTISFTYSSSEQSNESRSSRQVIDPGRTRTIIEHFNIDPYKKMCLIKGYSDSDYLLSMKDKIEKFEKRRINDFSIV